MIEVTDEMLKVARSMQSFELMIKRIIELYEANKPKLEPVAYISFKHDSGGWLAKPHEAEKLNTLGADFQPLYTTPPTPEPLSEVEILKLALRDCYPIQFVDRSYGITLDKVTVVDFARLIEQAHGIGVTND